MELAGPEVVEGVVVPVEEAIVAGQAAIGREVVAAEVHTEAAIGTAEGEATQATIGPTTKSADEPLYILLLTSTKRVSSSCEHHTVTLHTAASLRLTSVFLCVLCVVAVEGAAPRVLDVMEFAEVNKFHTLPPTDVQCLLGMRY